MISENYKRPLTVSITLCVSGEFIIFLVWGWWLYPGGSLLNKFVWTVGFCGLGMGCVIGALIDLMVVGKATGMKAIVGTTAISIVVLGSCNILCWRLDQHLHYFGGQENPNLFLGNGFFLAVTGGFLIGWLLFTQKGLKLLHKAGV